jgi:hypothetical protein
MFPGCCPLCKVEIICAALWMLALSPSSGKRQGGKGNTNMTQLFLVLVYCRYILQTIKKCPGNDIHHDESLVQ